MRSGIRRAPKRMCGGATSPSMGLLLDPLRAVGQELRAAVIDHVGGLADLDAGVVRAIGRAGAAL